MTPSPASPETPTPPTPSLAEAARTIWPYVTGDYAGDPAFARRVDALRAALAAEEARDQRQRDALALAEHDRDEARRLLEFERSERRTEQQDHENFVGQMREALRCAPGKDTYYTARDLRAELDRLAKETSR